MARAMPCISLLVQMGSASYCPSEFCDGLGQHFISADRLAMTLLHQYLPEIAIVVDIADASPGPAKIPAPGDIIQFLAIKEDGNLRILHGAKSEPMVAFISLHELSYPRLKVRTVGAAINIVTGRHNQLAFFSDLPFRDERIIGL